MAPLKIPVVTFSCFGPGLVTIEAVDNWWNSGRQGPDPRGLAPGLNYYYSYQSQRWLLRH